MEWLARLIDRRATKTIVVAFALFALAGVFGAGVAQRLDPFGADDPASESVIADQRLQQAGFREIGVVVLIKGVDIHTGEGRERIRAINDQLTADPNVASTASALTNGTDFLSKDGDSTYIAASLTPTSDRARQDAAERLARSLAGERGVIVGGPALAERPGEHAGRAGPAHGRAVRVPAPASALAALLPQP